MERGCQICCQFTQIVANTCNSDSLDLSCVGELISNFGLDKNFVMRMTMTVASVVTNIDSDEVAVITLPR